MNLRELNQTSIDQGDSSFFFVSLVDLFSIGYTMGLLDKRSHMVIKIGGNLILYVLTCSNRKDFTNCTSSKIGSLEKEAIDKEAFIPCPGFKEMILIDFEVHDEVPRKFRVSK